MFNFSIMVLDPAHINEICDDIANQVKKGVATMPLFIMTLTPEGDPVWDKAEKMCKIYAKYRDALDKEGVPSGILVQASLGHGYEITKNPFRRYVNLTDGCETAVCCPDDEGFLSHFKGVLRKLASEKPKAIMLDDDFRLMMRRGKGCACEYHMAKFNERAGTDMTREELYEHLKLSKKTDRLARIFTDIQRESLIRAATEFRAAIDDIDPAIQGINCTSGHICEAASYTNKIFAGKGNPTMVRVPNGIYAPITVRGFSDTMRQAAICSAKLRRAGIDIILAETDTIPFNRYAKSARYLHSHYTASLLEGLKGAKHWLTRTSAFEPMSGKAYRDILAKHKGMYERLVTISDKIEWVGCNSAFIEQEDVDFSCVSYGSRYHDNFWATETLERMGIPFYFAEGARDVSFLEGDIVDDMTDEQIKAVLSGSVFCDSQSAKALIRRGFGDKLGVDVSDWDLGTVSGETFDENGYFTCTKQKNYKKLTIKSDRTEALSYNYLGQDKGPKMLAPAVTKHLRDDGRLSVVFCGSPHALFKFGEGFAFLNETRKAQLVSLLREAGALPIYSVGDAEICLRAGYLDSGELLACVFELGIDIEDALYLNLEKKPESIKLMLPDGSDADVKFEETEKGVYRIDVRVEPMYPIILIIK